MSKAWLSMGLGACSVALCASAHALPFVYQVTQGWDTTSNASLFGTAAELFITVDNGSSTNVNQSYTWLDITGVRFATVGGTFDHDSAGNSFALQPNVAVLTTDGTGWGTLDIDHGSGADPAYYGTYFPAGSATLGGNTYPAINYAVSGEYAQFSIYGAHWIAGAIPVPAPPVPEPAALALIAVGLAGLGIRRLAQGAG